VAPADRPPRPGGGEGPPTADEPIDSADDAGRDDVAAGSESSRGCGCATGSDGGAVVVALGAVLAGIRRRRRGRVSSEGSEQPIESLPWRGDLFRI
jgi:MYXO-CTERM domain-containing protein